MIVWLWIDWLDLPKLTSLTTNYTQLNRDFYLKNCPKLKSLRIGEYSFSDYSVCEIESVDALEVIEMGDLNEESRNFYYASLELKSILIHNEWWLDMPSLKSLKFGTGAFYECSRVVFESE